MSDDEDEPVRYVGPLGDFAEKHTRERVPQEWKSPEVDSDKVGDEQPEAPVEPPD